MRQTLGPGALGKPRGSGVVREVGGGIGMGNTCKPMAVSFQCMTKFTTNKKKKFMSYLHFSSIAGILKVASGDSPREL